MAKILAASLNCVNGPTITPCGVCESCRSIADATSLDVIEMDAASNNSVDDVRDLREKVAYAPVSGRHKVYILDEAHMLTPQAWNAFLKTLEEPPPHTIFVLATTEANKVLPTVVDRCHRFDFARPTQGQIAGVLRRVADAEGIDIPDDATALVARSATGSFRDALGTLEQLVSYSGASVTLDDVLAVLGAADADLLFGAVDAVDAGDARAALLAAARLADSGRDVGRFFGDLEAHLRGLMIVQTLGEVPAELAVTAEQDARLAEQAGRVGEAAVLRLLDLVADALRAMKDGADPRTQLELALIKGARPEHDPTLRALMARIERLEGRAAPAAAAPVRRPEVPATAAGRAAQAPPPATEPKPAADAAAPPPQPPAPAVVAASVEIEGGPSVTSVAVVEPTGVVSEPEVHVGVELDLPGVTELWPAVLADVQERSPMLHALMENARPSALDGGELTLSWAESAAFYKRKAEDPACREQIATAIRSVTGSSLRLAYALADDDDHPAATARAAPALSDDELVDAFMREFDAEELPAEEES
jgi:DNA polymerase-3 subunit gamma/tau